MCLSYVLTRIKKMVGRHTLSQMLQHSLTVKWLTCGWSGSVRGGVGTKRQNIIKIMKWSIEAMTYVNLTKV